MVARAPALGLLVAALALRVAPLVVIQEDPASLSSERSPDASSRSRIWDKSDRDPTPLFDDQESASWHDNVRFSEIKSSSSAMSQSASTSHEVGAKLTRKETIKSAEAAMCDMTAERGVCLYGGSKVIVARPNIDGTVAHFTFDQSGEGGYTIDTSGLSHHGTPGPIAAPGRSGAGWSARFADDGTASVSSYIRVSGSTELDVQYGQAFSITLWVYLMDRGVDQRQQGGSTTQSSAISLISYGNGTKASTRYALELTLPLLSVVATVRGEHQALVSNARLKPRYWYHIALAVDGASARLHVNGVLDVSRADMGGTNTGSVPTERALFIGGSPSNSGVGSANHRLLDDVAIFSRPLRVEEIEASSFPSLGAIEPSYIRLACPLTSTCSAQDARRMCEEMLYHVCSRMELHAGGYQAANIIGWTRFDTALWTWSEVLSANSGAGATTLGEASAAGAADGLITATSRVAVCCKGLLGVV